MQPKDDGRRTPGPHATEGELHTLLDGALDLLDAVRAAEVRAHVEHCRSCRDRLAVESAVRDRAEALLGADDPLDALVLPSFDELLVQAEGVAPGAVGGAAQEGGGDRESTARPAARRASGSGRWAWAATVVLSLGVGYGVGVFGPEGLRPGAVPMPGAADGAPGPAAARVTAPEASEEFEDSAAEGSSAGENEVPRAATIAAESVAEEREAPAAPSQPEPAAESPAARPLDEIIVSGSAGAAQRTPASEAWVEARLADIPGDTTLRAAVQLDSTAVGAGQLRSRVADPSVVPVTFGAAPQPQSQPQSELQARRIDRSALGLDPLAGRLPAAGSPAAASGAAAGSAAAVADAVEADLGAPDDEVGLVLPGLTLHEVRWTEVWPGQEGVVAVQRLPDGTVLELRAAGVPVGGEPDAVEPPAERSDAPSGWARAVRRVEGGWLALDGLLPIERLRELLALAG
ncbi:hypothetical protein WI372_15910 [Gemmatimonadota bacterium DH-20]|uniref:Zinc-finger domain-containing protein n=1 Tax=Gaopeijia maritima TaxID=3119007 RepID=A0ABU9EEV8_9BACT